MYANLPRPTIFAHRGSSAHAPENTLAAFELAIQHGAPAIELDATLCADHQVVVIHDQTVKRTTGESGDVSRMPLSAIKNLDAGSWFDQAFAGEQIPTLNDVFETLGKKLVINIELKNYASPLDDLPDRVAKLVKRHNLAEWIIFSSFNPAALLCVRRSLPEVPCGLLVVGGKGGAWARGWPGRLFPYQALHPEASDVTENLIQQIHLASRRIHVYTVNKEDEMTKLFRWGVDGIFTDDPLLARQVLSQQTT